MEKSEEPIYKQLLEIISSQRITKLVISLKIMKSSAWKSRTAISGSFYVLRWKPNFCELFVICGGRLLSLREENKEGLIEACTKSLWSFIPAAGDNIGSSC